MYLRGKNFLQAPQSLKSYLREPQSTFKKIHHKNQKINN